jgi:hypothetical protein
MRADTKTITIRAPLDRVVEFLADPRNLPRWAIGFAKAIRKGDRGWVVTTASGEMGVRVAASPDLGVVDFYLEPAPGVVALAASRVVPAPEGVAYVFTQFQAPGMPDAAFEKSVEALAHELTVLKALLEVECPL